VLFRYLSNLTIPIVWTFHDCWPYTGACHHYIEEKCQKWTTECGKCVYLAKNRRFDCSKRMFLKKKKIIQKIKHLSIVTPSQWLATEVLNSFLKNKDIHVISNGIDVNIYSYRNSKLREIYNIGSKKIVLGVASHWTENKGLKDFVTLASVLDANYVIVLIGVEESLDCYDNIIAIQRTSNKELLAEWYSTADVYCNLSTEETFGLVVVEAMSCGTPVIVYDSTALPELVTGTQCYICDPHDIISVKNSIEEIAKRGKEFYKELCIGKAHLQYDKDMTASKYYELYKKAIRNAPKK